MQHFKVSYIKPSPYGFRVPGKITLCCESYEKLKELFEKSNIEIVIFDELKAPYAEDWIEEIEYAIQQNQSPKSP